VHNEEDPPNRLPSATLPASSTAEEASFAFGANEDCQFPFNLIPVSIPVSNQQESFSKSKDNPCFRSPTPTPHPTLANTVFESKKTE
jgi:hypothetical protein